VQKNADEREIGVAISCVEQSFGLLSPTKLQEVTDFVNSGMKAEMVSKAINLSIERGNFKWNYFLGILKNWLNDGILTLEQQENQEVERETNKRSRKMKKNREAINYEELAEKTKNLNINDYKN
jgi:DnaD/phage-associated family protein